MDRNVRTLYCELPWTIDCEVNTTAVSLFMQSTYEHDFVCHASGPGIERHCLEMQRVRLLSESYRAA